MYWVQAWTSECSLLVRMEGVELVGDGNPVSFCFSDVRSLKQKGRKALAGHGYDSCEVLAAELAVLLDSGPGMAVGGGGVGTRIQISVLFVHADGKHPNICVVHHVDGKHFAQ